MTPPLRPGITHFRRLLRWGARGFGAALALLLALGGYLWFSTELPTPERLRERAALGNTRILDRNGRLLYALPDPLSGRQRPAPLTEIPLTLRQATIAVEDASFYANPGVDLRGILRAARDNLRSGAIVSGGSTITQQLARNVLLDPELAQQRTFERKLRETVLALKLTATYSKDEILALYLNQIYYGGMSYGVEAAARHYFGKPVRDLDLAEAALLAGLPQAPSRYDPFADPEAAQVRQAQVLAAMVRAGFITPAEAATARAEPLQFAAGASTMRAPHFVTYALAGLTAEFGPDAVARGGLTVTTTLDADLQDAAQLILRRHIDRLNTQRDGRPGHQASSGAVVILDPADGAILAMVGSPDFAAAEHGQVNAALARRQPGSAIKPLTYAAALERGWTPASLLLDVPVSFPTREGRPYTPENYDQTFHGPLTLRTALATSSNVAAVRLLDAIGVPALLEMAARLGITSLDAGRARYGLALTLGGGEVTPLELTAAYAAFANGGQRVTPYAILALSDGRGAISPQTLAAAPPAPALAPEVAYLISDILSDPYARMRAFGTRSPLDIDRPAAAKTGTTSDWRDNWTIGYTPDRVVGVWVGNADGSPMQHVSGITGAGPIWHDVMRVAHRGLPPRSFARPPTIVEQPICAASGLLPAPNCPATRLERFVRGAEPSRPDNTHVAVAIDPTLGCRAPAGYPADRTVTRIFRILPPEAEAWAVSAGVPHLPRDTCPPLAQAPAPAPGWSSELTSNPPVSPPDSVPGAAPAPAIVEPAPGAVFAISPGVPRDRQQIAIIARAGGAAATRVTIMVDGAAIASFTAPPYRAFWPLTPGRHRALVEVEDAQGRTWRSAEVEFVVNTSE